ncbi:Cocaine esterase [Candidatus Sulfopaludibacter sp. SbA6]|nr:Cocaine esterase [Candidatus Sulfopaludibacter sp. SbA6]
MRVPYLILACCAGLSAAQNPAARQLHVLIPMRDGVRLAANVFLPPDRVRLPAILERTPYGKGAEITPNYQAFVDRGYAVVVEDVRGRYESEGVFRPLDQEPPDGDDTLNWIARQTWSDGKVGMIGGSYRGIVQWKAAVLNNPHLKAIFPVVAGDDEYRDRFYSPGGAMKLGHRLEWMSENQKAPGYHPDFGKYTLHLPLRTADIAATGWVSDMFQKAVAHPAFDSFWRAISTRERLSNIRIPVFSVGGWYDNFVESDLEAYTALHKTSGLNRILVGPWPHNMSIRFDGTDFGPDSMQPVRQYQLEWFDQWLMGKDTPLVSQPPVKVFVMGANKWLEAREWPPEKARPQELYLESDGRANSLAGDGALRDKPARHGVEDHYLFDPYDPAPTRGGAVCCNPRVFPWGPMDQRPVEQRKDVLVYTTTALNQDVEVVGPVQAVLYVATSAKDTDFTAKLVDVFPDGYARNLTDGILRLRYRNSLERPEPAREGEVYQVTVDAGVTGNVFLKGHRIRVEISSSNFPRFDRNPNTGGVVADDTRLLKASQTVYHDREHPSHVVLMVMPGR